MYINESVVLGALDVLCNIHEDGLKPYRAKVQEVLVKLRRIESCPESPCIQQLASTSHDNSSAKKAHQNRPADGDAGGLSAECNGIASLSKPDRQTGAASSGCIPTKPATTQQPVASGDDNASLYNHNPTARHADPSWSPKKDYVFSPTAKRLLDTLESDFETIGRAVSKLNPDTTVLKQQLLWTDPRLHDIVVAQGVEVKDKACEITQLRLFLSQRSLAIEFDSWDRDKNGGTSSLDKRIKALKENGSLQFARTKCPQHFTKPRFGQEYLTTVKK
ncbi:MAG: hypothetical protein Q9179_006734, partial [Wetmoreana sp. 5 TL-2023]